MKKINVIQVEGSIYHVIDTTFSKILKSEEYNYFFSKVNGLFMRWGKTEDSEPNTYLPEICDMELTEVCEGVRDANGIKRVCDFCYKSNLPTKGTIMDFKTFKLIFDKLPKTITQIAFGVDASATSNPYLLDIASYCRKHDVIPNITVADIEKDMARELSQVMGAIAVSYYPDRDKNRCYDTVKLLSDYGQKQINIHALVSEETYDDLMILLEDRKKDKRLQNISAIVFLSLKQKGRGKKYNILNYEKFKNLVNKAMTENINFGFDSCSCYSFLKVVKNHKNFKMLEQISEPCESSLYSIYINAKGEFYPCSFMEGEFDWKKGIDLLKVKDFFQDVWYNNKTKQFRKKLLSTIENNELGCRECPYFIIRNF